MSGTSGSPVGKAVPVPTHDQADGAPARGWNSGGAAGTGLVLDGVARRFGPTVAVSGVDLEVPLHGRLSIVGPSGCGKSTLLGMICGLDEPDEGTITVLDAEPRTAVLVTHDVEEALLIGERVAVMSARPGRIVAQFDVDLPHAGSRRELIRHPAFTELRDEILSLLEAVT
jgi:ABC-type nitrate/sulfonate/bicarbonate transport system ATPase subunit